MPWLQLKKKRQGAFRRAVRDADGNIDHWLEFPPGTPVNVAEQDLPAIAGDIGSTLMPMVFDQATSRFKPFEGEVDVAALAAMPRGLPPAESPPGEPVPEPVADPELPAAVESPPAETPPAEVPPTDAPPAEASTEDDHIPGLQEVLSGKNTGKPRKGNGA